MSLHSLRLRLSTFVSPTWSVPRFEDGRVCVGVCRTGRRTGKEEGRRSDSTCGGRERDAAQWDTRRRGVAAPPPSPPSFEVNPSLNHPTQPNRGGPGNGEEEGGHSLLSLLSLLFPLPPVPPVPLLLSLLSLPPSLLSLPTAPTVTTVPRRHPDRDRGRRGERWRSSR